MADKENTFLNANNIYTEVEGEAGKNLDLELLRLPKQKY